MEQALDGRESARLIAPPPRLGRRGAALGPGRAALILQAAAFGLLHIHGFPRGWFGVLLASVYGLMTGAIRRRSRGLLAPWLAHVCADLTIFALLWLSV